MRVVCFAEELGFHIMKYRENVKNFKKGRKKFISVGEVESGYEDFN